MKIIHLTDTHVVPPGETLFGLDPLARLRDCLAHMATHHADAALAVITGDLAHAGLVAEYEALRAALAGLPMPVRLLLGNHDLRAPFRSVFSEHPANEHGFVQSVLDIEYSRLIFLDTLVEDGPGHGALCDRRLDWLARALQGAGLRDILIFMHHPPSSNALGVPRFEQEAFEGLEAFTATLAGHRVRHVFAGHFHMAVTSQVAGIPVSVGKGTVHQIVLDLASRGKPSFVAAPPSYNIVLAGPEEITVHQWDFLDRATIVRPGGGD